MRHFERMVRYYLTPSSKRYKISGRREAIWMAQPRDRIRNDVRAVNKIDVFWDNWKDDQPVFFTLMGFVNNAVVYEFTADWKARSHDAVTNFGMDTGVEMKGTLNRSSGAVQNWHALDIDLPEYAMIEELCRRFGDRVQCGGWGGEWAKTRLYFRNAPDAVMAKMLHT